MGKKMDWMVMEKRSRVTWTTATYGILMIMLLWTVFPIYWMIKSSLTINEGMHVARLLLFSNVITFNHYIDLTYNASFMYNVWSSSVIAAIATVMYLTIGTLGSYAMIWLKYPGRSFFRNSIIISYLMPTAALFVLTYMFVSNLGFYDSKYLLLIIYPTFVVPHCCYMLISYFEVTSYVLEEAAPIDDRNRLQTLWYIITSITLPGITVIATFVFTMAWNEYLYTMIMTTSNMQETATVTISDFKYADSAIWERIISASVVCSLPVMLLYIAAQSMFISDKYEGSIK